MNVVILKTPLSIYERSYFKNPVVEHFWANLGSLGGPLGAVMGCFRLFWPLLGSVEALLADLGALLGASRHVLARLDTPWRVLAGLGASRCVRGVLGRLRLLGGPPHLASASACTLLPWLLR